MIPELTSFDSLFFITLVKMMLRSTYNLTSLIPDYSALCAPGIIKIRHVSSVITSDARKDSQTP